MKFHILLIINILLCLSSCKSFKQDILFQTGNNINTETFNNASELLLNSYQIETGDYLAVTVTTNEGEKIIDPNKEFPVGDQAGGNANNANVNQQMIQLAGNPNSIFHWPMYQNGSMPQSFRVDNEGFLNLPLVGKVEVKGMSLASLDSLLETKYDTFYKDCFVVSQYLNKRVFLLGALGNQIIPLRNENMTLVEIMALTESLKPANAKNIRIIRGDLNNPSVLVIDLTTIQGMQQANLNLLPGDIVYIEPRRRFDREGLTDINSIISPITSVISTVTSIIALILVINNSN